MSYQVLARKWRPQNFAQLVGQDHVKAALINALNQNRLHHAYLFTGTRGVGKTTIARIFAKSLNCEKGVTATPCGVCSACTEIDKGYFVDLLEIDAASRTKVEDTRDLLDNVQYAPSRGRYKVYLIDEVHMLSKHSFNALLKTLEEPPPHVKFLLATTDPQKLPITVLSRCLQFSLKALSQSQIKQHLSYILGQEQIEAEDEALALLARAAKGSLRDSLSLTDQAIAQTNGQIALGPVREMLGLLEQSWAELLLQDVLNRDLAMMQQHLLQLIAQHSQYQSVLDDMLALLHLAALCQFQLNAAELALTESAFVRAVAKTHSAESIQLYYQLLLSGKKDLAYAPDQRIGLEMALLRAIAFVPATGHELPQEQQQSGRAAALSAAGIPAMTTAVAVELKPQHAVVAAPAATPLTADSAGHVTAQAVEDGSIHGAVAQLSAATAQTLAPASEHHATAVIDAAAHNVVVNTATSQAATTSTITTNTSSNSPAVDPVTASILARRGMSSALPATGAATITAADSGADGGKKSERQLAPAQAVQNYRTAAPLAQQQHSHTAATTSEGQSVTEVKGTITAPSVQSQPALSQEPQQVIETPLLMASLSTASAECQNVPLDEWHTQAALEEEGADEEAQIRSHSALAPVVHQDDSDDEPDPVADSAGGDWAWQQYQAAEEPALTKPTSDTTLGAAPIRHALLDSLQVIEENTDFSAEAIEQPELSAEALGQVMEFDGVIGAHNFAVRFASQVDSWAARIDQLAIGGLMRLFLLHASPQLQDHQLLLKVSSSQRHLDNDKNRQTLAQVLSASFGVELSLTVEFVDVVPDCPLAIQQRIDEARRRYVSAVLSQDPLVQAMQQQFGAELLPDTLTVG